MPAALSNTRAFVELLKKENELLEITDVVDPDLELAEIQRHVVAQKGKALLFTNVKGCAFPVATNLYGSEKRIDLAFGGRPEKIIQDAVNFAHEFFPPDFKKIWGAKNLAFDVLKVGTKKNARAPLLQSSIPNADLTKLPQLKCWPEDGGSFITLPLVYTQSPSSGISNLGMYRIQLFEKNQCGFHAQIHRGGGFHYHEAEVLNQNLPVHIYVGGPPALTIAAVAPLPENVPEIIFASLLYGKKLGRTLRPELSPLPFLADADFCIVGEIPPRERRPEGPFGDHYGYYSLKHDYPFVNVKNIFHRPDAIYPATVVGRPPQEDHFIACYLQDIMRPLISLVMPQVKQVWAYEEAGIHSLAGAVVKERYPREALGTAMRILGEGQLSLSKVLLVTDQDCDVKDFKKFFQIILERVNLATDVFVISNISQDTLDYTTKTINKGSKVIILGLGEKKRDLPQEFKGTLPAGFSEPTVFCPGALCVRGPAYDENTIRRGGVSPPSPTTAPAGVTSPAGNVTPSASNIPPATTGQSIEDCGRGNPAPTQLAQHAGLENWPFVFLVDDPKAACASAEDFLWHIFTRFEPAGDFYARETKIFRHHLAYSGPIVIDCRLKPWYPKVLESDPAAITRIAPILQKHGLK